MKLLVTGSDGFIGKHVVRIAEERGHEVWCIDRKCGGELEEYKSYQFREYDAVIHLAANIEVKDSFDEPWQYVENNIMNLKVLSEAKRVIFASSAAVYGDFSPYGYTKLLGEELLPENNVSLRIFNPIGPGENHDPETHIVPILLKNKSTKLYHNGEQVRDFIDVRDVAEAFVLAAESDITGAYDLCNTPLSIREVADLLGSDYTLEKSGRDPGDTLKLVGDPLPLQKELNWKPKYNVKDVLENWRNWNE